MSVRVRRNFPPLTRLAMSDAGLMRQVGNLVLRLVRTRTQSGTDATGKPFKPLSPEYAAQKRKALGSSRADLTVSGRMLNDMSITNVAKNSVSVGYKSAGIGGGGSSGTFVQRSRSVSGAEKANYHANLGAGKSRVKRDFLGLTKDEQAQVENAVIKFLDKQIRT